MTMIVKQCDICGKIESTMKEFVIPEYAYKRINTCTENGWGCKLQEGIYPISVHICTDCQKKIADFVKSISVEV